MRIGLMGAPGSGKTALAEALRDALDVEPKRWIHVIDGYAMRVRDETHLAVGFLGGYLVNLNIALAREAEERDAFIDNEVVITCGTLLDTATYATTSSLANLKLSDEAEQQDELRRVESVMKVFACMYVDTFKYDHVFYLPATGGDNITEFDKNLQVAFSVFNLTPVTPLLFESNEDRLVKVMETIHAG